MFKKKINKNLKKLSNHFFSLKNKTKFNKFKKKNQI